MERFNMYVNKDGPLLNNELGKCWCWCGASSGSTGAFRYEEKTYTPQRMALFLYKNISLSTKGQLGRKCNKLTCINPDHLYYK
jgi:hypothetical protein